MQSSAVPSPVSPLQLHWPAMLSVCQGLCGTTAAAPKCTSAIQIFKCASLGAAQHSRAWGDASCPLVAPRAGRCCMEHTPRASHEDLSSAVLWFAFPLPARQCLLLQAPTSCRRLHQVGARVCWAGIQWTSGKGDGDAWRKALDALCRSTALSSWLSVQRRRVKSAFTYSLFLLPDFLFITFYPILCRKGFWFSAHLLLEKSAFLTVMFDSTLNSELWLKKKIDF